MSVCCDYYGKGRNHLPLGLCLKVKFVFREAGLHRLASDVLIFILLSCGGCVYQFPFHYQKYNHFVFQMQTGVL